MSRQQFVLFCIAAGALVAIVLSLLSWLGERNKRAAALRTRRMDLLAEALRDPSLDAGTRAELLRALALDQQGALRWLWTGLRSLTVWKALWVGSGWIIMCTTGAIWAMALMGANGIPSRNLPPLVAMCAAGFGMVSLPLAWRELTRRERVAATGR